MLRDKMPGIIVAFHKVDFVLLISIGKSGRIISVRSSNSAGLFEFSVISQQKMIKTKGKEKKDIMNFVKNDALVQIHVLKENVNIDDSIRHYTIFKVH